MKQAIKNFVGAQNALRLGILKKAASISIARFFRALSGGFERPALLPQHVLGMHNAHVFFGYYNTPQFNSQENMLLSMAVPLINKTISGNLIARLGIFDLDNEKPEFNEFGSTTTWCWQMGSRLQWYPSCGESTVLYNNIEGNRYVSIIQDVRNGKVIKSFQRPIYSLSLDGKWGLSLNFSRLQRLRPGYGYNVFPDDTAGQSAPDNDGIWRVDMETGEEKLLFTIRDIAEKGKQNRSAGGQHYFNHILFNNDGSRFVFLHVYRFPDGMMKCRLLTSSIDGTDIHLLNDKGDAGHYCWKDNNRLLCTSTVAGYFLFDDRSGETQRVGFETLKEDGHPSFLPMGRKLITDTYPDKYGELSLLLYAFESDRLTVLHKEYLPVKFTGETRCDFHPRVSPSGRFLCIDSVLDGKRTMQLFDISILNT